MIIFNIYTKQSVKLKSSSISLNKSYNIQKVSKIAVENA